MVNDSSDVTLPDDPSLTRRLLPGAMVATPPLVTVGVLLGVSTVAPGVGFLLHLGAIMLGAFVVRMTQNYAQYGPETGAAARGAWIQAGEADIQEGPPTPSKVGFLNGFAYGLMVFGTLGLVFVGVFLV
jgi:hypothetical protein